MKKIGIGIYCFGDEIYLRGTIDKVKNINEYGYKCYILTDTPNHKDLEIFKTNINVIIIPHYREIKSYSDKMILPKHILQTEDICILIDADLNITNFSFLTDIQNYNFKDGITYIDTLLNHKCKKETVNDLINDQQQEWKSYCKHSLSIYPNYGKMETMWEYFIVINKNGFNQQEFYKNYERLQLIKEGSDLELNKDVVGAGEGISIQISSKLSNTNIERDDNLYELLKNKMSNINFKHIPNNLWPKWMHDNK